MKGQSPLNWQKMGPQIHLRNIDAAWLADGDLDPEIAAHLRYCTHCRNAVADYRWLRQEIGTTLATQANAASVPQPKWVDLQELLSTSQRRLVEKYRTVAAAGAVLVAGLILAASPVQGLAGGMRTLPVQAMPSPSTVTLIASAGAPHAVATATPKLSSEATKPSPTPVFAPVPTPPES